MEDTTMEGQITIANVTRLADDIAELVISLNTIKRHPGVYLNGIKFQPIHSETLDKIEDLCNRIWNIRSQETPEDKT